MDFKSIIRCLLFLVLSGCAVPATVTSEQNPWVNLSAFRTYNWIRGGENVQSAELDARIRSEIDHALLRKGYRLDTGSTPDFVVAYQVSRQEEEEPIAPLIPVREDVDIVTSRYSEGTLFVSMLDPSLKFTLWRGSAEWRRSPGQTLERKTAGSRTIIDQIFDRFPKH